MADLYGYITNQEEKPKNSFFRSLARALMPQNAENWLLGRKEDENFLNKWSDSEIPTYQEIQDNYNKGLYSAKDVEDYSNLRNKYDTLSADRDYKQVRNQNIGQGIVDIGTGLIGGGGALATKTGINLLKPYLGKKIAQAVTQGAVGGGLGGLSHGFGTGLVQEDVNPLTQGLYESAIGTGIGALGGLGIGQLGKNIARNNALKGNDVSNYVDDYLSDVSNPNKADLRDLRSFRVGGELSDSNPNILLDTNDDFIEEMKNFNLSKYSKEERKGLRKRSKNYYKNNLKPKEANREDLGNIKFTNSGINEQISKGLHNIDVITDLVNQIEKGKKQPQPRYDYQRSDVDRFHIINNDFKNKNMEYQIAEDVNGKRFYFAKDITNNMDLNSANKNQHLVPNTSPNNSITNNGLLFNPQDVKIQWKDKTNSKISKSRYYPQEYRDLEYDIRISDHNRALKGRGRWEDGFYTVQEINGIPVKIGSEIDDIYDIVLPKISDLPKVKKELIPKIKSDIAQHYTKLNKQMPNLYKSILSALGIKELTSQNKQHNNTL